MDTQTDTLATNTCSTGGHLRQEDTAPTYKRQTQQQFETGRHSRHQRQVDTADISDRYTQQPSKTGRHSSNLRQADTAAIYDR